MARATTTAAMGERPISSPSSRGHAANTDAFESESRIGVTGTSAGARAAPNSATLPSERP